MSRFTSTRRLLKVTLTLTVVVFLATARPAAAQDAPVIKISQTVELDAVGNAAAKRALWSELRRILRPLRGT